MSIRNPTQARSGNRARLHVTVVRKRLFKHIATLHDRVDAGFDGLEFKSFTERRAQLAAWQHTSRVVNREADHRFDYSA